MAKKILEKVLDENGVLYLWGKIKTLVSDKVDKVAGKSLVDDTEITRLKNVKNYDDTAVKKDITAMQGKIETLEQSGYDDTQLRKDIADTYETKANVTTHTGNTTVHITATERTAWNQAEANAKTYADGLAGNYDTKGSATTAETNAKSYADGLAKNYDAKGAATAAETNAKSYTDAEIDKVKAKMVAGMHYKGSVDNYSDLPTTNEVGDMWNVKTASEHNKAGDNVVWDGTEWDNQGGMIDLSGYVKDTDIVAITNEEIDKITA